MSIRIGHASKDENNKATGGSPGDQTGKEVKISAWYDGGWGFLARAKDPAVAEAIAAAAEAGCNNPNIGYDQSGRNTLTAEAQKVDFDLGSIAVPCETDCSAFASVCVRAALGVDFWKGNAPTTRTLKKVLEATGAFEILTEEKYIKGTDHLRRGDILNNPGKHAVIVLDNSEAQPRLCKVQLPVLKLGSAGASVRAMQSQLTVLGYDCGHWGIDGHFGPATRTALEDFQRDKALEVDATCGPKTWAALLT